MVSQKNCATHPGLYLCAPAVGNVIQQSSQLLSIGMPSNMDRFLLLLLSTSLLSPVFGSMDWDVQCINGIQTALGSFVFAGSELLDYYTNMCTHELTVTSMWAAAKVYCTPKEIAAGSEVQAGYCTEYGMVELTPYSEVLPILTDDYIASLQVVTYDDIDPLAVWNDTVLLSEDLYKLGYRTTVCVLPQQVRQKY